MFNQEEKVLQFSDGRYTVNSFGEVKDSEGLELTTIVRDGVKYIWLDWIYGRKEYEYGLIVAVATRNIQIPKHLIQFVQVFYEDGNKENTFPSNLCYRFSKLLEIEEFPGFYYIPYYTRYGIDENGRLLCLRFRKIKKWIISSKKAKNNRKGGYFVAVAHHDYKGHRHISRHRAKGLTFLEYSRSVLELVINHKDGVPGNDDISNLEWVTKSQNNQHAYDNNLFSNKVTPILVKNWITGEVVRYDSIMKCSRALGKTESFLHVRAKKSDTRYSDGLIMKFDDGSEWPEVKPNIQTALIDRDIVAKNVFTGEMVILDGPAHGELVTGVKRATISYHCNNETLIPTDGFNFRYFSDDITWPVHTEHHLKIYKMFPSGLKTDGVIVHDELGNELAFFESIQVASSSLNIPKNTIIRMIKDKTVLDGKTFSSFKLIETLAPLSSN